MKKKTGVVISSAAAIAVCASVMAGSTYALFTSESKTDITVKSGTVKVVATVNEDSVATKQLYDTEWTEGVGGLFGGTVTIGEYSLNATDLVAGDGVKFTIDVSNVGSVNAKYRTVLKSETDLGELKVTIGGDAAAYDGATVYGMWSDIAAGDTVEGIVVTMQLPEEATAQNVEYKITYAVEAIQGNAETHDGVVHIGEGVERKDYLTLQAAFDAAAAGDTLYIDEDIKVYGLVEVKNGVTVEGNNHTVTILNDLESTQKEGCSLYAKCSGLTFKDITFNLRSVKATGLYMDGAYMYTLENVKVYGEARHCLVGFVNSSGGIMKNCTVENTMAPENTFYNSYGVPNAVDVFTNRNTKLAGTTEEGGVYLQLDNTKMNTLLANGSTKNFTQPKVYINDGTVIDNVAYCSTEVPASKFVIINGGATVNTMHATGWGLGYYRDMLDTENEVYLVTSANGLKIFADLVNGGNNYNGATVRLTGDIDLAGIEWTPIADSIKSYPTVSFSGTFDGQGHTISNLTTAAPRADNPDIYAADGLFGAVNGIIRNVTVENITVSGTYFVGAIVGYSTPWSDTLIENCHVKGAYLTSTPVKVNNVYDNGSKVGGVIGYCEAPSQAGKIVKVVGCSVEDATIKGYRDIGGIVGCALGNHQNIIDNTVNNVTIIADQNTNSYGQKDVNADEIIGRRSGDVDSSNTANNVSYEFIGCVNANIKLSANAVVVKDVASWNKAVTVSGEGTLVLENVNIAPTADGASALTLAENATVTLVIKGECTLKGAKNGDGITVPASATLDLSGDKLVAIGNNGFEYFDAKYNNTEDASYKGAHGCGISINGTAKIHNVNSLTAEGYGENAVGLGGATMLLEIADTTIEHARGGMASAIPYYDNKYAKDGETAGGPAIGVTEGGKVKLTNVTVNAAEGGAKSAAIGGIWWQGVSVVIDGCTLNNIVGGHSAAAIGGGRIQENATYAVSVKINDSTITAQGGYFGAGIGTGYDTHCVGGTKNEVIITGNSKIAAVGGKYAAGIGTGFHAGNLTGYIEASVDTTGTAANEVNFYKAEYTTAQAIGYGVSDPNREMNSEEITFKVGGAVIADPRP